MSTDCFTDFVPYLTLIFDIEKFIFLLLECFKTNKRGFYTAVSISKSSYRTNSFILRPTIQKNLLLFVYTQ